MLFLKICASVICFLIAAYCLLNVAGGVLLYIQGTYSAKKTKLCALVNLPLHVVFVSLAIYVYAQ